MTQYEVIKYPDIHVDIVVGENAAGIIGRTTMALERAGVPKEEIDKYIEEATSGDYEHLIIVTELWVST